MKTLGQIAFEAYGAAVGGKTYDDKPIPQWGEIKPTIQQGWEVAAKAALAQHLSKALKLTERELTEIKHALFYCSECNHGTVGHNMLVIIAKMAIDRGFRLELTDGIPVFEVTLPDGVEIVSK